MTLVGLSILAGAIFAGAMWLAQERRVRKARRRRQP
jgi:hypothetical protein